MKHSLIRSAIVLAGSLVFCAVARAGNQAVLHGIDYQAQAERWHFEATQLQIRLTVWKNDWPFAKVVKGGRKATDDDIEADVAAVPMLGQNDFFLYYYSGHGSFVLPPPPANENCQIGAAEPNAYNYCDEVLSAHLAQNSDGLVSDDDMTALFLGNNIMNPKKLGIFATCYGGGFYWGNDFAGGGDLERNGKTGVFAGSSENEPMAGGNNYNIALADALKPVLVNVGGGVMKWRPNADVNGGNNDGMLTIQEWHNYVVANTAGQPGFAIPRFGGMGGCDCPPAPHLRGQGGVYRPLFYSPAGANIGAIVIANELAQNALVDTDGDGLYDHQEAGFGTDPTKADTDGDNLTDYDELFNRGTDPLKKDTDRDGVNDDVDPDPLDPNNPGACPNPPVKANFRVINNSGAIASGLHLTFANTGGTLCPNRVTVLVNPATCGTASINTSGGSQLTLDWQVDCVAPGAPVIFRLGTDTGPISIISGEWLFTSQPSIPINVTGDTATVQVPTVSQWGTVIMTLALLIAATIVFTRRPFGTGAQPVHE